MQVTVTVTLAGVRKIGPCGRYTPPHLISGASTLSSASIGLASYSEQVEFSGTVRGRIGYAPGNWLFYGTGGFAWTYDQFTRTQLAGTPAGGTAIPGTVENAFMVPRAGWTAGSGVEVALWPKWTARFEYLFTDYGTWRREVGGN
jgi:high affinity Mn2+ porin